MRATTRDSVLRCTIHSIFKHREYKKKNQQRSTAEEKCSDRAVRKKKLSNNDHLKLMKTNRLPTKDPACFGVQNIAFPSMANVIKLTPKHRRGKHAQTESKHHCETQTFRAHMPINDHLKLIKQIGDQQKSQRASVYKI